MAKSSIVRISAIATLLIATPFVVQCNIANAATAKKKVHANESYKALSVDGTYGSGSTLAPSAGAKMWPGVAGMAAPEPITPWKPTYAAPRGGREY